MKNTYVLVANANTATIYRKNKGTWEVVDHFDRPESHLKNSDLISDREGRVSNQWSKRTKGLTWKESPRERKIEMFAKLLGEHLEKIRSQGRFDQLVLVAPPRFLGTLSQNLSSATAKLVMHHIGKDLSHSKSNILDQYLTF